jgi:hypothetical protein
MTAFCRTLDDVLAAADENSRHIPPLSQHTADLVAAILATRTDRRAAA